MLLKSAFATLAVASTVFADEGSVRSRRLTHPDPHAGKILDCFLVNLDTEVEIKLDGDDNYNPSESTKGWSIYCKTTKNPGQVDFVNFFYDVYKHSQYYSIERYNEPWLQPFWMKGDNNGLTVADANPVKYLAAAGPKTVKVTSHSWDGGDEYPGDEKTYHLNIVEFIENWDEGSECDGSYSCPANSSKKNDCPQSVDDCECDSDYKKEGGQCVKPAAVCNDPQPPNPRPYSCHLFGNFLYPGGGYLGNFEIDNPSLQFRTTTRRFRTRVRTDKNLFITRGSFKLRYLSESKCAKSSWVICKNSTPIGLDIDNSGAVERMEGSFKIDLSGDGNMELLNEWFAPTEGILISTIPEIKNGHVTGQNLFGDMGQKYEDGFAKLSLLDKNADSIVSGAELDGIAIWVDANSNAHLDEGELKTLESFNIVGLRTDDDEFYASSAMLSDGTEMYMEDLWFTEDLSYSRRRSM